MKLVFLTVSAVHVLLEASGAGVAGRALGAAVLAGWVGGILVEFSPLS